MVFLIKEGTSLAWAGTEFNGIDLGDKRLNKRAVKLLDTFSEKPTLSIPGACNGWGETQAAYRFLAHDDITWADILAPHQKKTHARIREHAVALCIDDTTELDFNGQQIDGLGRLSYDAQRGMYLHPTYVVTPQRVPLGLLNVQMWAREVKIAEGEKEGEQPETSAKKKESSRWIKGYEHVATLAETEAMKATRLVYITDREGDIMELMTTARDRGNPADWLIRSQHNRVLPEQEKLWATVEVQAPIAEICFALKSRRKGNKKDARKARPVRQQIFVKRVALPDGKGGTVQASCIIAKEIDLPVGEEAVVWRLLTNRDVPTQEAALELIDWYRARWEIEMLFDVFKNGCRVEALQLSTIDRVECALALYLIVAWRIAHLMRMGRICPDMDARLLFDPEEVQAAYLLSKKPLPKSPPRLDDVIRLIAGLGGFLGRKSDGDPGAKTLWIGLQRLVDFIAGMHAVRESCV